MHPRPRRRVAHGALHAHNEWSGPDCRRRRLVPAGATGSISNTSPLLIGNQPSSGIKYTGRMDEVSIG